MYYLNYSCVKHPAEQDVMRLVFDSNAARINFIRTEVIFNLGVYTLSTVYDDADYSDILIFSAFTKQIQNAIKKSKEREMFLFGWESWRDAYENAKDQRESNPLF